ncbi:hypothetical protein RvVAT039_35350 [Agrobacterium vitis]|nr:hypothetical protein RvVAT039_35350 [Agrobacterium vitis]
MRTESGPACSVDAVWRIAFVSFSISWHRAFKVSCNSDSFLLWALRAHRVSCYNSPHDDCRSLKAPVSVAFALVVNALKGDIKL